MRKISPLLLLNVFLFGANLDIGTAAPNFELKDQDGVIHKLNDYKGKKLVIYFFPKAETPGWIKQACGFRDEFDNYKINNISILGVSFDSQSVLKSFKDKYSLNFNLLSDSERVMGNAYSVNKWYFFPSRKTFLIDEGGILVHIFDDVNLHSHPDDILKFFNNKQ